MKKLVKIASIFIASMCFLTTGTAYAVTGTYTAASPTQVDIGSNIGLTYSANKIQVYQPYDVSPDGDYWATVYVSGFVASGGSWGFGYFGSDGQRHVLSSYTSDPSGSYDVSGVQAGNIYLWADNSSATGETNVYFTKLVSNDGAVLNMPTPSNTGGGSQPTQTVGVVEQFPAPPSPPDWNQVATIIWQHEPQTDWGKVAQTFYDTWAANVPPIPEPPDPEQTINQIAPSGYVPPVGNTNLQTQQIDTPQEPPESGKMPFDLNQNQPTIQVDSSESKPIQVQDPVANLPHDPVNSMPKPDHTLPSPFNNPNTPVLDAPSYSGSTQPSGGGSIPTPTQQAPSGTNTPTPTGSGTIPSPSGSSANPNPTYNYP